MNARKNKVRLTLEIEVTVPPGEDHERSIWTAAVDVAPTLPGVTFGRVETVGVEAEDDLAEESGQQIADVRNGDPPPGPDHDRVSPVGSKREPEDGCEMGLTLPVVRNFGIAFGLWGYSLDVALNGKGQGKNPDLVAIEESDSYAAILDAIEAQEPSHAARREVAGTTVWVEERPSNLYAVLRETMFEAYRWGPHIPEVPCYGVDRLVPPTAANSFWVFSADPILDHPDLFVDLGAPPLSDLLVAEGVVRKDQVRPSEVRPGRLDLVFRTEGEGSTFLRCFNRWLSDRAVAEGKRRWNAAGATRT